MLYQTQFRLFLPLGHRLLERGGDRAEQQQRDPPCRGRVTYLQPRRGGWPVISLNSDRPGAAARPERNGSGMVSSCRATNTATSRGALRRANRLSSHRLRTSLAARHALLPLLCGSFSLVRCPDLVT